MRVLFQTCFACRYEVASIVSFSFSFYDSTVVIVDAFHNVWESSRVTQADFFVLSEKLVCSGYLELPDMVFSLVDRGEVYPE